MELLVFTPKHLLPALNKKMVRILNLKYSFVFVLQCFVYNYLTAQPSSKITGNWLMFFNQTRLHKNWSIHTEVQYRSFEIIPNTEQLLLRGGINFHINNSTLLSAGYANVTNYAFDKEQMQGIQASENRTWQQFIVRNNLGRCFLEHRYRLEQRWIQSNNNNRYLDRIRYLLRVTVPLNKKEMEKKTIFLSFYNEVFIHFSATPFDRNRLYGALGYQFLKNANIQIGYLAQSVGQTTRQYFQTAIFYNIDFRKQP